MLLRNSLAQLKEMLAKTQGERTGVQAERDALNARLVDLHSLASSKQKEVEMLRAKLTASMQENEEQLRTIQSVGSEGDALKIELRALEVQLGEVSSGCDSKVQQLHQDLTHELESLRSKLVLTSQELDQKGQTLATVEGACESLKTEAIALNLQIAQVSSQSDSLRQHLSITSQELEQKQISLQEFKEAFQEFKGKCNCSSLKSEFEAMRQEFASASQELEQERGAFRDFKAECTCSALQSDVKMLKAKIAFILLELEQEREVFMEFKAKCKCDSLKSQLDTCMEERDRVSEERGRLERLAEELKAKIASTSQELEQEREAFTEFKAKCKCDTLRSQLDTCMDERDRVSKERDRLERLEKEFRTRCDMCQCETLKPKLDQALETIEVLEKKLKPRIRLA